MTPDFVTSYMRHLAGPSGEVVDLTPVRLVADQATAVARAFEDAPPCTRVVVLVAQSFTKRAAGVGLVKNALPCWDLTHVIDLGRVYIPGQGYPALLLVGRAAPPLSLFVRVLRCLRGEPGKPEDPARGVVWSSVVEHYDCFACRDKWTACADVPRSALSAHPWSLDDLVPVAP